ncbi:MAG: hypothetical protein HY720_16405 [Planctomycetes bacterium]|nr:hypothetical protein [Planctomycetota bacterium]
MEDTKPKRMGRLVKTWCRRDIHRLLRRLGVRRMGRMRKLSDAELLERYGLDKRGG